MSFKCFYELFQSSLPLIGKGRCMVDDACQQGIEWDQYLNNSCILNISEYYVILLNRDKIYSTP
jgi:hypothetical protein